MNVIIYICTNCKKKFLTKFWLTTSYTLKKLGNNTIQDDAKLAVIRSTTVFISHITSAYPFFFNVLSILIFFHLNTMIGKKSSP